MIQMIFLVLSFSSLSFSQDIKLTPDLYEFSPFSVTGVYLCTPRHVESGDCTDVDKEYYDNMARITLGIYEIGLLEVNGEKTIAFKGPLSPGAADVLIEILEDHPEITKLTLSSQGGSEEESYKIADYIKERSMDTWVPTQRMCLSACVAIFLSGKEKLSDGLIGMHTGQYFLNDSYQVRNLEAAQETISQAMYENNIYMLRRVQMFLELNIDLSLIQAMNEARGEFLVFSTMQEILNYDHRKNYVLDLTELLELSKSKPTTNFDFQSYTQLF